MLKFFFSCDQIPQSFWEEIDIFNRSYGGLNTAKGEKMWSYLHDMDELDDLDDGNVILIDNDSGHVQEARTWGLQSQQSNTLSYPYWLSSTMSGWLQGNSLLFCYPVVEEI